MSSSRSIKWGDIANTKVGKSNQGKIDALWSAKGKAKSSKHGNKKVTHHGITFHSKGEGDRYLILKDDERKGVIRDLRLQVPYLLTDKARDSSGKAIRAMKYIADFVYIDTKTGKEVVEDFKGQRTQSYIDKSKLMFQKYGIEILETRAPTKLKKRGYKR